MRIALISILLPRNRPRQLAEALISLAEQDCALGEVLIVTTAPRGIGRPARAAIAPSPIANLIQYLSYDPPHGPATARPLREWRLTESVSSNAFRIGKDTYTRCMQGPSEGNVGDWAWWLAWAKTVVLFDSRRQLLPRYARDGERLNAWKCLMSPISRSAASRHAHAPPP